MSETRALDAMALERACQVMQDHGQDFIHPAWGDLDDPERGRFNALCSAIRAYLAAAPAPTVSGEPVAWRVKVTDNGRTMFAYTERLPFEPWADSGVKVRSEPEPLYAHPAPTRAEVLEEAARYADDYAAAWDPHDGCGSAVRTVAAGLRALAGEKP